MGTQFEVTWTDEVAAPPEAVWDAITRVGGAETGLTPDGIQSAAGLHRIYGRDRWGWPVSIAHHLFDPEVDAARVETAWRTFLDGVHEQEEVA